MLKRWWQMRAVLPYLSLTVRRSMSGWYQYISCDTEFTMNRLEKSTPFHDVALSTYFPKHFVRVTRLVDILRDATLLV
jgi:hypothetical protein